MSKEESVEGLEELLEFLKSARGLDFTGYKRPSLIRRIGRRMQDVGVGTYEEYVDYLEVHPGEFTSLLNSILINVTSFFRDAEIWSFLASRVIPAIVERKQPGDPIRVWSAGCASGEEAYSAVILLAEALGRERFADSVKVYGTDIDEDALTQARQALYPAKSLEAVPVEMRDKYFSRQNSTWSFDKDLRRAMIFGRHHLVHDAPISRIDLLLCRNTLMYLNAETQAQVLAHLHFAVGDGGYVVLGKAEMLFSRFRHFTPVDLKRRVFSKNADTAAHENLMLQAQAGSQAAAGQLANHIESRQAAFDAGPASQIVVDKRGYLAQANARARGQFGLRSEDIGRPFHDLEISYRPVELRGPIEEVERSRKPSVLTGVNSGLGAGETHFDVEIIPLIDSAGSYLGVSLTFRDVTHYRELQLELENSNQELETAMEELQSTNEELETTNEELQSTNEELETTNEELQSTNEELETMNEELQSTNEELATVNEEMRDRTEEIGALNAFLEAVLETVRAGVAVVDEKGTVSVWNKVAEDLWGVRTDEVEGSSLFALDIGLDVDALKPLVKACITGASRFEEVRLDATNRRGRKISCHVTCAPLGTSSGAVENAILFMEADPSG